MKILLILFLIFFENYTFADNLIGTSQQLIMVITPHWHSVMGKLQRYCCGKNGYWLKVGKPISVVLGKQGMAIGMPALSSFNAPKKQEGDRRTPAGIFALGPNFGFAVKNNSHMPYFALTQTSVCIDDIHSHYYNQLINNNHILHADWHSGEVMRQHTQYRYGSVVQYNTQQIPGAGSCIFLHSWESATTGTQGCIAMQTKNLQTVLSWLDATKKPKIVILPQAVYRVVRKDWGLP